MRTININDHHFELPTTWQEIITGGHYMDVVRMLCSTEAPAIAHYELFKMLTGFDPIAMTLTDTGHAQLSEQMVASVFPCFDFIYDAELVFIINPIPSFDHNGVTYTGPSARLNNQTGFQWEKSHHMQVLHDNTKDIKYLEQVVYTNYLTESKPGTMTPLPADLVYGITLWYGKCEKWWSQNFPWLFPAPDEPGDTPQFKAPPTGREVKDMIFKLAGSKLNADWDIVRGRSRQDIIYALDELEKERERIESQRAG